MSKRNAFRLLGLGLFPLSGLIILTTLFEVFDMYRHVGIYAMVFSIAMVSLSIFLGVANADTKENYVKVCLALIVSVALYLFGIEFEGEYFGIALAVMYGVPFLIGMALRLVSRKQYRLVALIIFTALSFFFAGKYVYNLIFMPTMCFVGDTKVLTSSGGEYIKDVSMGEMVVGYSDEQGEVKDVKVLSKITSRAGIFIEINGDLKATREHPFYVADGGEYKWVLAEDLEIGDCLVSIEEGGCVEIENIQKKSGLEKVYNVHVAETENYYVLLNGIPVLVHNKTPEPISGLDI